MATAISPAVLSLIPATPPTLPATPASIPAAFTAISAANPTTLPITLPADISAVPFVQQQEAEPPVGAQQLQHPAAIAPDKVPTFVFSLPPLGKPNPKEKYPVNGCPDTRSRVVQQGSKGSCWYYVFNMLRERIGHHPKSQSLPQRKFEKMASEWNKEVSKCFDLLSGLENPQLKQLFQSVSTKGDPRMAQDAPQYISFLKQNRYSNYYDFLRVTTRRKLSHIHGDFLRQLGLDPEICFEELCKQDPLMRVRFGETTWEQISTDDQMALLHVFVRRTTAKKYGFKLSSWHLQQPISKLIQEILFCGPLVVDGFFGQAFYPTPAIPTGIKIEGREIYGWPATNKRDSNSLVSHVILLVGAVSAKNENFQSVYFIDPNDESDPKKPSSQKIYIMSYNDLVSRIVSVNSNRDMLLPIPNYAMYGPKGNDIALAPVEGRDPPPLPAKKPPYT